MKKEAGSNPESINETPKRIDELKRPDVTEKIKKDAENRLLKGEIDEKMRDKLFGVLDEIKSASSPEEKLKIIDRANLENIIDNDETREALEREVKGAATESQETTGQSVETADVPEIVAHAARMQREAEKIIESLDKGGVPAFVSKQAEEVLLAYGFSPEEINKKAPADLFNTLKEKMEAGARETSAETLSVEKEKEIAAAVTEVIEEPGVKKALVEAAAPADATAEENKAVEKKLESEHAKKRLAEKIKEYIKECLSGHYTSSAIGFLTGAGGRFAIRNAIRATYGSSLGVGIAAGAVAGGVVSGVKEIWVQRRMFSAEDIVRKMNETQFPLERAAILAKAEKMYEKARISGSKEELEVFADELRATRVFLAAEAEKEKSEYIHESGKDKIINILKFADDARKDIAKSNQKEVKEMLSWVDFEREKIKWRKVGSAALKGAVMGALGGAIGGAVTHWISDHIHHAHEAAGAVHGAAKEAASATSRAVQEEAFVYKAQVAARAARAAAEDAEKAFMAHDFSATIEKGQGVTHAARHMIHDFLVNQKNIHPEAFKGLSVEQLVHAEDTATKGLVASLGHDTVNPGEQLHMSGSKIAEILQKSKDLTPEKIENIAKVLQDPTHHLSQGTIGQITDFEKTAGVDHFYEGIQKSMQEAAKTAVSEDASKSGEAAVREAGALAAHESANAAGAESGRTVASKGATNILWRIAYGGAAAATAATGYGIYRRNKRKADANKETEATTAEAEGEETQPAPKEPAISAAETEAPKPEKEKAAEKEGQDVELKQPTAEDSGEYKESRTISLVTLELAQNYQDLNAPTSAEGEEAFAAKTKELWKKIGFAVHGMQGYGENGKSKLKGKADLDGRCAGGLLGLAGIIADAEYVKPGEYKKGRINIDTGGKHGVVVEKEKRGDGKTIVTVFFDHHADKSGRDTSSTKIMYEALAGLGLLEKNDSLDKMVEFVTQMDNKTFPDAKTAEERLERFEQSSRTLLGLYRFVKFDKLVEFFKEGRSPVEILSDEDLKKFGEDGDLVAGSKEQGGYVLKSLKALETMKELGLIIDSERYGKIAFDFGHAKQIPAGFDAAAAMGFDTYIIWDPKAESFLISSKKEITDKFPQGFIVRKHMWMKPRGDKIPLTTSLEDILRTMTDGKFRPNEAFKAVVKKSDEIAKKKR